MDSGFPSFDRLVTQASGKSEQLWLYCFSQVRGETLQIGLCSSHDFRFIARSYINPHSSVEKFKAAGPCDTDEKIQPHAVEKYSFQLLLFQRIPDRVYELREK